MFRFLKINKHGFTVVELLVVLVLLSFGVLALANMFRVTYRAFNKAEERAIKQEAVKTVAELLQKGSEGVSAAQSADIFNTIEVVPTASAVDRSYSYLYCIPHYICSECEAEWNTEKKVCSDTNCTKGKGLSDGYFICIQDKGKNANSVRQLSDVPIYMSIDAYNDPADPTVYYSGLAVKLAALEDDYFEELKNTGDVNGDRVINFNDLTVTSDHKYYSLDVQYHFPNMATKSTGVAVNHNAGNILATANKYDNAGNLLTGDQNLVEASDNGVVLRVYCDSIVGADATESDAMVPSLCFIATASYGQESGEVGLLCKFRDECLLTNPLGTAFVKAYYKLSPPIADFIRESEPLKAAVRFGLKPLVAIATNALDEDAAAQNAPWFIMFMLCGAGATATLIKVDKRRKKAR